MGPSVFFLCLMMMMARASSCLGCSTRWFFIVEPTDYCGHKYLFEHSIKSCMSFVQFVHTKSIFAPTFRKSNELNELIHRWSVSLQQQPKTTPTCANARHLRGQRSQCAFWWTDSAGGAAFITATTGFELPRDREELEECAHTRVRAFQITRHFSVFAFARDVLTCQHSAS